MISIYQNTHDTTGTTVTLKAVIERILDGKRGLDEKTRMCNVLAFTDPDAHKTFKAKNLPAVTFAGMFPPKRRRAEALASHTGFVVLDIDGLSTSQLPEILAVFAQHPYVKLAFVSPSGNGIKVVVNVTPIPKNDAAHKTAWQACVDFFQTEAEDHGFEIDTSGKDCSRLCFLAHDPQAIIHSESTPIPWDPSNVYLHTSELDDYEHSEIDASNLQTFLKSQNVRILGTRERGGFFVECLNRAEHTGAKQGKTDSFIRLCENGLIYHCSHSHCTDKKSGWFFEQRGILQDPFRTRKTAKLLQIETPTKVPTETLETNRENRDEAADTFLSEKPNKDKVHIILIKDTTGTGKSHTVIFKSNAHGKTTIANTPHNDLGAQIVEIAHELGYKNPFHLLGREHNWEKSGIEKIPVEMRTPDLFKRNNCIMVDQIKAYKDKRLAPRTYCETQCPFRDGCPHLAQYIELGTRDLIANSTPNLLFDLHNRGYLQSIVTASDETSDEELAIDPILGTESKPSKEFNFAIIDDYGISGLYTDISFSESDFKGLKKAWSGTPTGTFATLMLKAFKKKKPKKIVKALRNAFETTAEHHTETAKSLTQHARFGVVEYVNTPKASKETEKLLSEKEIKYVDGGRQFIPTDLDAYEELTSKGIPCVNPQLLDTQDVGVQVRIPHAPVHALMAGVHIDDLTPVWQKGVTPINLLDIFLKSIGNDKNAPINRTFKVGDPPVAILTFSIPPQAPTGIMPQIAMLSATSDINETKRAFDGQPVTFSEHTGGILEWADGVQVFQHQDARLTTGSVFEYPTSNDGKRLLQESPTGLKATAEKRLAKLNDSAKQVDGLTAFISYKDFTDEPFKKHVNGFDIVTHFDKVTGLNFDGLKYLVVFGYPKVKHKIVMEHARKQYASDSEPLPKADPTRKHKNGTKMSEYLQLTEEITVLENGYEITERRYIDPRLEKIRHQLSTEKLEQAIGRARLPSWTDTTTVIFTNAPVASITDRATLFSSAAFNLAETPSDIPTAMERIQSAEKTGDVKAVIEAKGISKSQAYEITKETRKQSKAERDKKIIELHQQGLNKSEIHRKTGVPRKTVSDIIKRNEQGGENSDPLLVHTYNQSEFSPPPTNPDEPCLESESPPKSENERDYDPLFKLLDILAAFHGKKQRSPSDVSQITGIDEPEVREILDDLYLKVLISPGVKDKYWMSDKDIKNLWEKIVGPVFDKWSQDFPGQKILCPPEHFNPQLDAFLRDPK